MVDTVVLFFEAVRTLPNTVISIYKKNKRRAIILKTKWAKGKEPGHTLGAWWGLYRGYFLQVYNLEYFLVLI